MSQLTLRYQGETKGSVGDCYWTLALLRHEDGSWWMGVHSEHKDGDTWDSDPSRLEAADVDAAWEEARNNWRLLARSMLGLAPEVVAR